MQHTGETPLGNMCVFVVYVRDDAGGDADGDREMPMEHERREPVARATGGATNENGIYGGEMAAGDR